MKRFLLVATLAVAASAGTATRGYASGAFGLFYCPKYCTSYCQACCPHNAFSSNGCLMQCGKPSCPPCCPPPTWPMTGYGCGGCGAYGACGHYGNGHYGNGYMNGNGYGYGNGHGNGNGNGHANGNGNGHANGHAFNGCCGTGPCCRNPTPHAMHLVQSSPQQLGPVCCHGCGMDTYGTGGLGYKASCGMGCKGKGCKGCKGGSCADESGDSGFYAGAQNGPMIYPNGPAVPAPALAQPAAQGWAGNPMVPVSYQGYYYGGYGYYPNYAQPMYNQAAWTPYGLQRGW
jgi:hypothetical protein